MKNVRKLIRESIKTMLLKESKIKGTINNQTKEYNVEITDDGNVIIGGNEYEIFAENFLAREKVKIESIETLENNNLRIAGKVKGKSMPAKELPPEKANLIVQGVLNDESPFSVEGALADFEFKKV